MGNSGPFSPRNPAATDLCYPNLSLMLVEFIQNFNAATFLHHWVLFHMHGPVEHGTLVLSVR